MKIRQRLQPGPFVGGEDRERRIALGQHLALFKDHLVLESLKADSKYPQPLGHVTIAGDGRRFVIPVGQNRRHTQRGRQRRNHFCSRAVTHDQPAAPRPQRAVQFDHAGVDELHPPVGPLRQRVENRGVKNEGAKHLPVVFEGVVERRMIEVTQVATKPDKSR